MNWLYYLILIVLVIVAYNFNLYLGIGLTLAVIIYGIYKYIPTYYGVQAGRAYQAGNYELSRDLYKKAMDTGRPKFQIRINYAHVLMRTGNLDEAESVLDYILRFKGVKPEHKNVARQQRCLVYYRQGRLDEAISEAEELYESGYKNTNMYGMIGYFKILTAPKAKETLDFCVEAYEYNDEDRDIMDNLSICYYNLGDYEKAKEISDKLMESNPNFIEAFYHGAQILDKLGDYKTAAEYLDKISECSRSDMTTVSEQQVEELKQRINEKLE